MRWPIFSFSVTDLLNRVRLGQRREELEKLSVPSDDQQRLPAEALAQRRKSQPI